MQRALEGYIVDSNGEATRLVVVLVEGRMMTGVLHSTDVPVGEVKCLFSRDIAPLGRVLVKAQVVDSTQGRGEAGLIVKLRAVASRDGRDVIDAFVSEELGWSERGEEHWVSHNGRPVFAFNPQSIRRAKAQT